MRIILLKLRNWYEDTSFFKIIYSFRKYFSVLNNTLIKEYIINKPINNKYLHYQIIQNLSIKTTKIFKMTSKIKDLLLNYDEDYHHYYFHYHYY